MAEQKGSEKPTGKRRQRGRRTTPPTPEEIEKAPLIAGLDHAQRNRAAIKADPEREQLLRDYLIDMLS